MLLRNVDEGVAVALNALRSNKLRSFLTILGVVIGVSTVMTMASIVDGIRTQIFNALNAASPNAFYVMRFFSQTPLNPDNLPYEVTHTDGSKSERNRENMPFEPFDLPAAHIFKVGADGLVHEIEAVGFVAPLNSPTGWE